jgi:amino acid transporter
MSAETLRFKQSLQLTQLFTLGFGMVIGVGWMLVVGDWLRVAGSIGALVAFVAGALVVALVGLCYAEMATAYPESGGEVVYAERIFGQSVAFAVGWLLVLIYVTVTAFEAVGFAWLLGVLIPAMRGPVAYSVLGFDVHVGSIVVGLCGMALFGWINWRGAAIAARVQDWLIYTKVLITVGFVILGIAHGDAANLPPYFAPNPNSAVAGFMAVFITAPFWFAGFGIIPQALGERAPGAPLRMAGLSIVLVILASCLFYCLIIIAVALVSPRSALATSELPAASAFEAAFGSRALRNAVIIAGMTGLLTTWNALFFSAARVLYAISKIGYLPRIFSKISDERGTPGAGLALVTVVGSCGVFAGRAAIAPIVNLAGLVFSLVFVVVCAGVIARRRMRAPDAPFQTPGGSFTAALAALVSLGMAAAAIFEIHSGAHSRFSPEFAVLGIWLMLGLLVWMVSAIRMHRRPGAQVPDSL